ncbi:MAG: methyltransferase domain-containing protein [Bacteroidetes bacterium]|nr:methyltransferase domain-containing protein [Bacteroidota bacterium]
MHRLSKKVLKKVLKRIKRKYNSVQWYNLRSTKPISKMFGMDRGTPIDRYYIDHFLSTNQKLIKGVVCEIAEDTYTKKFGVNVTKKEVLCYTMDNSKGTIIGDLTNIATLPENVLDCFICTQTLNFIYDFEAAIAGIFHLLKPGGSALVTVAGISQISRYDMDRWGDYWRFTKLSLKKAFINATQFDIDVKIDHYGNVLASVAFLEGIAAEELTHAELMANDEDYQLLITAVVKKIK